MAKEFIHAWKKVGAKKFIGSQMNSKFTGVATLYKYTGNQPRVSYGVVVEKLSPQHVSPEDLIASSTGVIADSIAKTFGLKGKVRLLGPATHFADWGGPIGKPGNSSKWSKGTMTFVWYSTSTGVTASILKHDGETMTVVKYRGKLYRSSADSRRKRTLEDMQEALAGTHYLADSSRRTINEYTAMIKTSLWVLGPNDPLVAEIKSLEAKLNELSNTLKDLETKSSKTEIDFSKKYKSELGR